MLHFKLLFLGFFGFIVLISVFFASGYVKVLVFFSNFGLFLVEKENLGKERMIREIEPLFSDLL